MVRKIFRNRNKDRDPLKNEGDSKVKISIKRLGQVNDGSGNQKVNEEHAYSAKTLNVSKLRNTMTENNKH